MVAVKASVVESPINRFQIGDIMEICMNPRDDNPTWFKFWNQPLRDNDDVRDAKEVVETSGASLGWGNAACINHGYGDKFRTVTP